MVAQTRVAGVDEDGAGLKNYLEGKPQAWRGRNEVTAKKCPTVLDTNEVLPAPRLVPK